MTDSKIDYAHGGDLKPVSASWLGTAAFGCSAAAAGGVRVAMYVLGHPIPGPAGGVVRDVIAPILAVFVLLLWIGGTSLAIVAGRRRGFGGMATAALAIAGGAVALLGLMVLLHY